MIQTKILLVDYLFRIGHFAAAIHEAHSASSLAVASGLHKIRTAQPIPAYTSFIDRIDLTLQEPQDQIEDGERINAFWAVFLMGRCLSVMIGPPLVISDMDAPGMQIDTPWPLEMETYERWVLSASVFSLKLIDLLPFLGTDIPEYVRERDCA